MPVVVPAPNHLWQPQISPGAVFLEEQNCLQLRTLWFLGKRTAWTWVGDELLAFETFKHGWNLINKTRGRDEYRDVQGEGELEPSPSPFQRRSVFRNTPECRAQLLVWQMLPSKVKIPIPRLQTSHGGLRGQVSLSQEVTFDQDLSRAGGPAYDLSQNCIKSQRCPL